MERETTQETGRSRQVEVRIDVSDAVGLGMPAAIFATVVLPPPEDLPDAPVICMAMPSSSYARGYYTCALPGAGSGAQGAFHASRGWIFVALDWLGCDGERSGIDPEDLGYEALTAAAHAAQAEIALRLANGVLAQDYPPVGGATVIGIGQSLGAALLIYQQARHGGFDGIGVLGFSAIHAHPATPPGGSPVTVAWYPRDARLAECREPLNAAALAAAGPQAATAAWEAVAWGFHHDDVPVEVVEQDLAHYEGIAHRGQHGHDDPAAPSPPWYARRTPQRAARSTLTPGVVATEAAAITVPVLAAMGERDLVPDPRAEPRAYASSASVDVFVCPRMGHVHNMAGTRALLWERIHRFGEWCARLKTTGNLV